MTITYDRDNVRFTIRRQDHREGNPFWVFNAQRISDEHYLPGQILTETDIEERIEEIAEAWFDEHGTLAAEPPATLCYSCNEPLVSDADTDYQFDNALWVTLDGGYGMFVESDSFLLVSDFWQSIPADRRRELMIDWVRNECGLVGPIDEESLNITGVPSPLPEVLRDEWMAYFEKHRHHKVVICHECAHAACDALPWLARLIDPHSSHAHRTSYIESHPDHTGWDYDRENA